jgi:hypothetical protein
MHKTVPALVACVVALGGCQTWGPTWSEITGARYPTGQIHQYRRPATIENIDGRGSFPSMPIKIEPGMRRVVLSAPTPGWPGGGDLQVMMLDVEPCKRYYLNAQFRNPVDRDWTAVIDFVEPIAGCRIVEEKKT